MTKDYSSLEVVIMYNATLDSDSNSKWILQLKTKLTDIGFLPEKVRSLSSVEQLEDVLGYNNVGLLFLPSSIKRKPRKTDDHAIYPSISVSSKLQDRSLSIVWIGDEVSLRRGAHSVGCVGLEYTAEELVSSISAALNKEEKQTRR